jgi:hypothetical protein
MVSILVGLVVEHLLDIVDGLGVAVAPALEVAVEDLLEVVACHAVLPPCAIHTGSACAAGASAAATTAPAASPARAATAFMVIPSWSFLPFGC